MPIPSTETRNYDALLSTTLENWAKGIEDEISTSNFLFWALRRSKSYVSVEGGLGERVKFTLMYQTNNTVDTYSGYDPINTTPQDGITAAFYNWGQMAGSVSISRMEERQNAGEYQMVDLLDGKANQTLIALQELFGKALLQGNGINSATDITTPFTSTMNGSTLFAPLPLLVSNTAGINTSIGNINPSTYTWWRNQQSTSSGSTFAAILKELSKVKNDCSKGPGGAPDIYVSDQATSEMLEAALRVYYRNNDVKRAEVPFENIVMPGGRPLVWDEYMPNWSGGTTAQSTTQGTLLMLNSKFFMIKYDSQTNFTTTPFVRPENQDAKTAMIMWYGTTGVTNRRKHGVLSDIDTTVAS